MFLVGMTRLLSLEIVICVSSGTDRVLTVGIQYRIGLCADILCMLSWCHLYAFTTLSMAYENCMPLLYLPVKPHTCNWRQVSTPQVN